MDWSAKRFVAAKVHWTHYWTNLYWHINTVHRELRERIYDVHVALNWHMNLLEAYFFVQYGRISWGHSAPQANSEPSGHYSTSLCIAARKRKCKAVIQINAHWKIKPTHSYQRAQAVLVRGYIFWQREKLCIVYFMSYKLGCNDGMDLALICWQMASMDIKWMYS